MAKHNPTFFSGVKSQSNPKGSPDAYATLRKMAPAPLKRGYNIYAGAPVTRKVKMQRGYDIFKGGPKTPNVKNERGYNIFKNTPNAPNVKNERGYDIFKNTPDAPKIKMERGYDIFKNAPASRKVKMKRGYDITMGPKLRKFTMKRGRGYYSAIKGPKLKIYRQPFEYTGPMDRDIEPPKARQRNVIVLLKPNKIKKPKICKAHKKFKIIPKYENDYDIWR
ncbi:MAG: hypothetical protein A3G23_14540 [Bacteroidetes bacterium RIFCSPLOWO2_12_FULL_37_12]|nr:MAG: hypothetical protein A3G23_14540 [Bacteroidetes bacterium RIFCSPLOWO2_12_FULL_37_12]